MLVFLEGICFKFFRNEIQSFKDKDGNKCDTVQRTWHQLNYQILGDFGANRAAQLETLSVMEEEPPAVHPILESAAKSKAPVRILVSITADRRKDRAGELNMRIVDVVPAFELAPAGGGVGSGKEGAGSK